MRSINRGAFIIVLKRRSFAVFGGRNYVGYPGALGHILVKIAAVLIALLLTDIDDAAVATPEIGIVFVQ